MRKDLCVFATFKDETQLRIYARSIGLTLLNPDAHKMTAEENDRSFENPRQGGYFSFLPVKRLHRHPINRGLCDVLDPIIDYIRPYYDPPNLIAGQIRWKSRHPEFAALTKPYYAKLWRWAEKHWRKRFEDGYFIGPEADKLAELEETQLYYLPPGVKIEKVVVPDLKRTERKKNRKR